MLAAAAPWYGRRVRTVLALLAVLPLAARAEPIPVPPRPTHYVTDGAGVLDPARAAALDRKLAEFERATSNQVLVWIAPRVPEGTTMEELGADAIRAWGVGQKGKDNGVVLFVFTEPRRTRIATGYGLEGAIPDIAAKRILVDVVRPHVARADFTTAVEAGADAILALAAKEGYAGRGRTVAERDPAPPWLGTAAWVGVAALLAIAYARRSIPMMGIAAGAGVLGAVGLVQGFTPAAIAMQAMALVLFAPLAFVILVVQALTGGRRRVGAGSGWTPGFEGSSSSSDGWSSSSSSSDDSGSSSDFDGGGGDSGGGGASDDG
jgi:uncharacterized protein